MELQAPTNRSTKVFLIYEGLFGLGGGLAVFPASLVWHLTEGFFHIFFKSEPFVHLIEETSGLGRVSMGFIGGFLFGSLHGVIYWNWLWIRRKGINATLFWAFLALVVLLPSFAFNLLEDGWNSVWNLGVLNIFIGYPLCGAVFGTFLGMWDCLMRKFFPVIEPKVSTEIKL